MTIDETPSTPPPAAAPAPEPAHPHPAVQVIIPHQETYSRGLSILGVIFLYGRMIALIPVFIVLIVLGIILGIGGWLLQFAVLFTGKYPKGAHEFFSGIVRLQTRTTAWHFGLVDKYPGFSLKP